MYGDFFLSRLFTEININHSLFTGTKKAFDVFLMLATCTTHVTFEPSVDTLVQ